MVFDVDSRSARAPARLGDPVLDRYLEFVEARCRPNTVLAAASDLRTFFGVVGRPALEVTPIKQRGQMMGPVPLWAEVAFAAVEDRSEGTIVVEPGQPIEGTVRDAESNEPIPGVVVGSGQLAGISNLNPFTTFIAICKIFIASYGSLLVTISHISTPNANASDFSEYFLSEMDSGAMYFTGPIFPLVCANSCPRSFTLANPKSLTYTT